jgi:hypothetical protein
MRHQKAYCVCRQIHAQTAASHHAVPIGVCASAPDVRQGALGGRRARLDGVNSCFGSGRALVREFVQSGEGGNSWISELPHPGSPAARQMALRGCTTPRVGSWIAGLHRMTRMEVLGGVRCVGCGTLTVRSVAPEHSGSASQAQRQRRVCLSDCCGVVHGGRR